MKSYERYELLSDRADDLVDLISDLKHILTYGIVRTDRSLYDDFEDKILEAQRDLERTRNELRDLEDALALAEEADFQRMTL